MGGHHLSCVAKSGALGEALEKGYIALDNIDLMGTESDIADAKKVPEFEGFGLGSWKVWDSFQNFKQTSSEEASTADFYDQGGRLEALLPGDVRTARPRATTSRASPSPARSARPSRRATSRSKEGWPTFKKIADGFGGIYWDRYASFSKFKM